MRIVAGRFKGRSLRGPASAAIRPTSDRLREALFNILVHRYGDPIWDARVIDLFSGTGALGLEALSRGATFALFVDDGTEARSLLRENIDQLALGGSTKIFRRDATRLGAAPAGEPFSLAFLDPPYGQGLAEGALTSLHEGCWLRPGSLVVVEEAAEVKLAIPEGFDVLESRRYSDTQITILRAAPMPVSGAQIGVRYH
jgi:16S rRNA (guanine966-N2)-methyltransferase